MAHAERPALVARHPVHVTLRCRGHVWNLRSRRCFRVVEDALRGVRAREDLRVVHFSVQGNHLHLILEADGAASLARGVQALSIRAAKGLNRLMGTRGAIFGDRYHAHVLRTPSEARAALCYVLQNFRRHAAQRGARLPAAWLDPYSSAATFDGWRDGPAPLDRTTTSAPATWLLVRGWRRRGCIRPDEVPGARPDAAAP